MRILFLEDDARTAEFVVSALTNMGYGVDHTDCVPEGAALAGRRHYELIIAGWMGPGFDQRTLMAAIRGAENRQPVMFLTGLGAVGTSFGEDGGDGGRTAGSPALGERQMICSGFMVLS